MQEKTEIRILGIKLYEKRNLAYHTYKQDFLSNVLGTQTSTGKRVTDDLALTVSAVWGCVQLLSNTFAIPALNVYRKTGDIREIQSDHPSHLLIHRKPNQIQTNFTWRRSMMMAAAMRGNAYSLIHRNERTGAPESFEFLPNANVPVKPFLYKGKLWYDVKGMDDAVPSWNMIHYMWNSVNGIEGKSPLSAARENVAQAITIQEYGSKVFAEGGSKRVALKSPAKITEQQKDGFRKLWDSEIAGVENLQKLMFLEGGAELAEIGMSPEDAQMLGTMKFKIEEICRFYSVPLHLVQSLDHATNNNIEHQAIQFIIYTMMAHYVNFEQELNFKLFPDNAEYYTKHNTNALVRGDMKTESEYFGKMSDIGVYSINDIRRIKDENPIPDGDGHYVQLNRMPIEKMNKMPDETLSKLAGEANKRSQGNGHKVNVN